MATQTAPVEDSVAKIGNEVTVDIPHQQQIQLAILIHVRQGGNWKEGSGCPS